MLLESNFCRNIMNVSELLLSGENVLIHGPGGTGKSYSLRNICSELQNYRTIAVTATTGVAAINVDGRTLHSWAGIGLGDSNEEILFHKISKNNILKKRWLDVDILVIDEISMLGKNLFEKLEYIARRIKNNSECFGGIQILASGDFFQLPPVNDTWVFESEKWKALKFEIVNFEKCMRYSDEPFFDLLLELRLGVVTTETVQILTKRILNEELHDDIKPTILYPLKKNVESYNQDQLKLLPVEETTYKAVDVCRKDNFKTFLTDLFPENITLKPGAQVMLTFNINVENRLVNGSRGVILKCFKNCVEVKFKHTIETISYTTKELIVDKIKISRSQIPLMLAWAVSIHKSQGATLDCAICDIGKTIFTEGQAYVALSRVRNLESLYLSHFDPKAIKVDKKVLKYFKARFLEG